MMGPFMPYRDTGKICTILSISNFISFSFTILALIAIILFFRKLTPIFAKILFFLKTETAFGSSQSFMLLFVLPILNGTIINILISRIQTIGINV